MPRKRGIRSAEAQAWRVHRGAEARAAAAAAVQATLRAAPQVPKVEKASSSSAPAAEECRHKAGLQKQVPAPEKKVQKTFVLKRVRRSQRRASGPAGSTAVPTPSPLLDFPVEEESTFKQAVRRALAEIDLSVPRSKSGSLAVRPAVTSTAKPKGKAILKRPIDPADL